MEARADGEQPGDDADGVDAAIKELAALEEYCSGPEFVAAIQESISGHCGQFDGREEDHPVEWYDIFQGYAGKVESLLEAFLKDRGVDMDQLAQLCAWADSEAPHTLFSVGYLLAALDYQAFVELMLDHKRLQEFEVPDDLPGGARRRVEAPTNSAEASAGT